MPSFGAISFAAPWALAGLAVLPVVWWLLRLRPPPPNEIAFPPIRLIREITGAEQSPAAIPPWLLALRVILVLAVIFGAAGPVFNAGGELPGGGPLVLVIDDDWPAADNWQGRQRALRRLIAQAERRGRGVVMVTTAIRPAGSEAEAVSVLRPAAARKKADALTPKPWPADRTKALTALAANETLIQSLKSGAPGPVFWLADGFEGTGNRKAFIDGLKALGTVTLITDPPGKLALMLEPPVSEGKKLKLVVRRAWTRGNAEVWLRALGGGHLLARRAVRFKDGDSRAETVMDLLPGLRNQLERIEIEGESSAGAVVLIDERWRRRPVGLISVAGTEPDQPLLRETYYLSRALSPFTELGRGRLAELLERNFSVLVLTDGGKIAGEVSGRLKKWVKGGGVLVRFAGPNLARRVSGEDFFLPVRLRGGGRAMGGALSWVKPVALAPFPKTSPFRGLAIPNDIAIRRQVLAQPSLDLAAKTWARLDDGTPLVTADRRGAGWVVLFHTTANASWSNLALSGLFVGMLRRIVDLGQGVDAAAAATPLGPIETLDGFGRLAAPPPGALAIAAAAFAATRAGPGHPPGFYGDESRRRALNLSASLSSPRALSALPPGITRATYGKSAEMDLRPLAFGLALALALLDLMASSGLRGLRGLRSLLRPAGMGLLAVALLVLAGGETKAQTNDAFVRAATLTRLAYVVTGDRATDRVSRAGLGGLSLYVNRRTAAELGKPVGVDVEKDELSFFPLLYWPVTEDRGPPSVEARARVGSYLSGGGTILFDTRGGAVSLFAMARLSRGLDLPTLVPMPPDHVLTRSFYLLKEFPGRWTGGEVWIEQAGRRVNDGVATVIAGSNDWAAAWALDEGERPLFQAVPGGAGQREAAFRFGINLVIYTLTGNYKSDQIHAPFILRRLGR